MPDKVISGENVSVVCTKQKKIKSWEHNVNMSSYSTMSRIPPMSNTGIYSREETVAPLKPRTEIS